MLSTISAPNLPSAEMHPSWQQNSPSGCQRKITSPSPSYSRPRPATRAWSNCPARRQLSDQHQKTPVRQKPSTGASFSYLQQLDRPVLLVRYRSESAYGGFSLGTTQRIKHRNTKETLWIHGPGCVEEMLEKEEADDGGSQGSNGARASGWHTQKEGCPNSADPCFSEPLARSSLMCNARFRSGLKMDAQLVQEGKGWEVLSSEEILGNLDRTTELHPVENFICILQKCRTNKNLAHAKRVHAHICNVGLEAQKAAGNYIVSMFVDCGSVSKAQQVFDRLVHQNEHSWTSLILGYIERGQTQHALNLYQSMQKDNVRPSSYTHMAVLKACARLRDVERGREMHSEISQKGFERDVFVGSTLVDMYAKCGSLLEAQEVFDRLVTRTVVTWNALIAGYAEHGPGQEALNCFEQMQQDGTSPDIVTFICVLKACGRMGAVDKGRKIHVKLEQKEFGRDLAVGNTLLDMYAKCGSLLDARKVFDKLPARTAVSWTALIAGYAENGPGQEALNCFAQMEHEGVTPDAATFACILKACGSIRAIDKGREIHRKIAQKGFGKELTVCNSLVDMYAKCGLISEAWEIFDKLPVRDVVSWTVLIAGYAEHGLGHKALKCFELMQLEGICPNALTYASVLKTCGSIGAIDKGREIHIKLALKGFERNVFAGNNLVDMYVKYGSIAEAQQVFDKLPVRGVVLWSVMIKGYGMNHEGTMAVQFFEEMQEQNVKPDAITLTCLLTACNHANLIFKAQQYFEVMRREYGIAPTIEHHTCMVDLFAQSGYLYEGEDLIETMLYPPLKGAWTALLNACKSYGEADLGLRCFHQLVQMNPESAASYVLLANLHASSGRWDATYRIEELRKHTGVKKNPLVLLER